MIETLSLTTFQQESVFRLWNENYPIDIAYTSLQQLDAYLKSLSQLHHFLHLNTSGTIDAWAFTFVRDDEIWFGIIVDKICRKHGYGSLLLNHIKNKAQALNGWMVDTDSYTISDGTPYISPAAFYHKHKFNIIKDERLIIGNLSVVKIRWHKDH